MGYPYIVLESSLLPVITNHLGYIDGKCYPYMAYLSIIMTQSFPKMVEDQRRGGSTPVQRVGRGAEETRDHRFCVSSEFFDRL